MPTGLIDHLPDWERTNLLRFLSELGKPGPFGYSRLWHIIYDGDESHCGRFSRQINLQY